MKYYILCCALIINTICANQDIEKDMLYNPLTNISTIIPACIGTLATFAGMYYIKRLVDTYVCHKSDVNTFAEHQKDHKKITIFVHGTLAPATWIPGMYTIIRNVDIKNGLHHALDPQYAFFHGQIPKILNREAPDEFPIENFYFFGWSGDLNHRARLTAAHGLYQSIKQFKSKNPQAQISLIGHSHGGTIALLTALIAQEHNDNDFKIDKTILLAMPVQKATEHLAHNTNIFKEIFVNYSEGDWTQRADPQGIQSFSPQGTPLFSKRTLSQASHIKQAAITFNKKNPWHLSFAFEHYVKNMPKILEMMQQLGKDSSFIDLTINGPKLLKKA